MQVGASGGVSIGNTTDPGAGSLSVTGMGLFGTTSALGSSTNGKLSVVTAASPQIAVRHSAGTAGRYWTMTMGSNDAFSVYTNANAGVYMGYGDTSWSSSSDERLKTELTPIENAVQKIKSLRSVIGRFLTDDEKTRRSFLIAQDVQAVFPEAVSVQNDEEKTLGLRYADIIPLLVAAIKEQQITIDSLTLQLNALEK